MKNGCNFFNIDRTEKFPITDPNPNGKVQKTELTENVCLLLSECRKVTTQKCFKSSHTSMLKLNLGWVTGKTEPMEKFGKLN